MEELGRGQLVEKMGRHGLVEMGVRRMTGRI
jgi:hypothetical protein